MDLIHQLHVVRHVLPLPGYLLLLDFEDRELRVADLSPWIERGGAFAPLMHADYFEQVRVDEEAGTVVWPNGLDLDPDVLYSQSRPIRPGKLREWLAHAAQD
jgi:hypothetical protein